MNKKTSLLLCTILLATMPACARIDEINVYGIPPKEVMSAIMEINSHQYDKALEHINTAIDNSPDDVSLYNFKGILYEEMGNNEEAFKYYTIAISMKSDYPTPYFNRATLYREMGDYQQAMSDLTTAIKLNYPHSSAYVNRGYVRLEMKDISGALEDFNIALSREDTEGAYYGRALCNFKLQNYEAALSDATNAIIKFSPINPDAYLLQGQAKIKLNKYEEGLQDIKWAKEQYLRVEDYDGAKEADNLYNYYSQY